MRRFLYSLLTITVVVGTVFVVGAVTLIRKPMPDTTGELALPGLSGEVVIRRDAQGVPHITADTPEDLFFAQGYVNAQDRFHEMDVRRHVAAGRLRELVDEHGIGADRLIRALKVPEHAERDLAAMPNPARRVVEAYARGVNAYSGGRSGSSLGLEYTAKTLVGRDYRPEQWRAVDSVAWASLLDWSFADGVTDDVDRILIGRHMPPSRVDQLYPGTDRPAAASKRMRIEFAEPSGVGTLLALRDAMDTVRKATGLPTAEGTDAWVSGQRLTARVASTLSIPGPWYQIGLHCRKVSAACPYDVSGLSLTGMPGVLVGRNSAVAWGLAPAPVAAAQLDVAKSKGPVDGTVVGTLPNGHRLVLTSSRLDGRPGLAALLALDRAATPDLVRNAAESLHMPFDVVYLSASGERGDVPAEPDRPVAPRPEPAPTSQAADILVPRLMALRIDSAFAREGQRTLRGWDRRMSADHPAAAYFAAVWRTLLAKIFHDEIPWAQWPDGSRRWTTVVGELLDHPTSTWWDDLSTPQVAEHRDDILRASMIEARDELTRIQARDVRGWDWGTLHGARLQNPTLAGVLFERGPVRLGGSGDTDAATAWNPAAGFETTAAPVASVVADMRSPDESRWIQSTGASGHPFSPHYTDQLPVWSRGATVRWPWSVGASGRAMREELRLGPAARVNP